jgi:hypothetical protein
MAIQQSHLRSSFAAVLYLLVHLKWFLLSFAIHSFSFFSIHVTKCFCVILETLYMISQALRFNMLVAY